MNHPKEGQNVPNVTFHTRRDHTWVDVTSEELFANRNVIVFSLPGAFTPTCSSSHVPRYNQLARSFFEQGIDDIICISVNDAFVMNQWQEEQRADHIRFLPDGNGDFTRAMGLLVNKQDLGFGERSWRYSMLVRNGRITKMFVETEAPGDPFDVSDADTMLEFLAPGAVPPPSITVFTRSGCAYCARAKSALEAVGLEFEELRLGRDFSDRTLRAISTRRTYPQIFIDGERIGGADELDQWLVNRHNG